MILWAGDFRPIVLPVTYSVRLNVGSAVPSRCRRERPSRHRHNAGLREQFDCLMRIRDKTSQANDAVKTIRNIKAQLAIVRSD